MASVPPFPNAIKNLEISEGVATPIAQNDKLLPHVVKTGTASSIIGTNEEQRREAARNLAERHNAALRSPTDDATSRA
jgi:hypothetical protein